MVSIVFYVVHGFFPWFLSIFHGVDCFDGDHRFLDDIYGWFYCVHRFSILQFLFYFPWFSYLFIVFPCCSSVYSIHGVYHFFMIVSMVLTDLSMVSFENRGNQSK